MAEDSGRISEWWAQTLTVGYEQARADVAAGEAAAFWRDRLSLLKGILEAG